MPLAARQYRNRPARTFTYRYYYFVGSQRIATYTYTDTGEQYWLLSDHLGSTSVTADVDGDLYSETRYSAFGEVRYSLNNTPTDYMYTGQRNVAEIGLYYYVARFYDPQTAHFISADTVVPRPGSALSYDRYAYTSYNPINFVDPSGHADCIDCGAGGGGTWIYTPKVKPVLYRLTGDKPWTTKETEIITSTVDRIVEKFSYLVNKGLHGGESISPEDAFLMGFKHPIEFYRSNEACDWAGWGGDPYKVTVYDVNYYDYSTGTRTFSHINPFYIVDHPGLLAHELGHVLYNAVGGEVLGFPNGFSRPDYGDETNAYRGFAGGFQVGQYAVTNLDSGTEIFADMLLGWLYPLKGGGNLGMRRYAYMNHAILSILTNK